MRLRFAALTALLLLLFPVAARAAAPAQIAVTGTGSVSLPPDQATVDAAIETNAQNARDAVSQNEAAYERIVAAVVALGVARSDITLAYYNVNYNPRPRTNPSPGVQYGYTVNRSFAIKMQPISLAGNVVDAATSAGATAINGVYFGLRDTAAASREAMKKAVADAVEQGNALSASADLHIIGIESITLAGAYAPVPRPQGLRVVSAALAPTTFDNSNTTVTVTVNVVFLAKP
ncbi:MAG TPA: SIMPL domain-containing protein [Candidatus Tyrphobacter sp.]